MVGPKNIQLLDTYKGEICLGDNKVLIDKSIIDKINFIREGHFTEKDGEGFPTLKLIGTVEGIDESALAVRPDSLYPLTTTDVQKRLGLNKFQFQAVVFYSKLKEKDQYHAEIKNGKKVTIHKYAEKVVPILERYLSQDGKLEICIAEYKKHRAMNKK